MKNFDLEKRRYVLSAIASLIIVVYIIRLFSLQIASDDYRKSADSNAFLKKIEFPSRGTITDRNGKLLVYNQPAYDIMVVMNEEAGRLDTMDFCNALGITASGNIKSRWQPIYWAMWQRSHRATLRRTTTISRVTTSASKA